MANRQTYTEVDDEDEEDIYPDEMEGEVGMEADEEEEEEDEGLFMDDEGLCVDDDTPSSPCRPPNNTKEVLLSSYHIQNHDLAKRTVKTIFKTQAVVAVNCKGPPQKISLLQVATYEGLCFIYDLYLCPEIMTWGHLGNLLSSTRIVKCAHMVITSQQMQIHPCLTPPLSINMVSCTYGRGLLNVAPHVIRRMACVNPNFWEKRPLTRRLFNYAARGALCLVPEVFECMLQEIQPGNRPLFHRMVEKKLAYPVEDEFQVLNQCNRHLQKATKLKEELERWKNMEDDGDDEGYDYPDEDAMGDDVEYDESSEVLPPDIVQASPYRQPLNASHGPSYRSFMPSAGFQSNAASQSLSAIPPPAPVYSVQRPKISRVSSLKSPAVSSPCNALVRKLKQERRKPKLKTKWPNHVRPRKVNPAVAWDQGWDVLEEEDGPGEYSSERGMESTRVEYSKSSGRTPTLPRLSPQKKEWYNPPETLPKFQKRTVKVKPSQVRPGSVIPPGEPKVRRIQPFRQPPRIQPVRSAKSVKGINDRRFKLGTMTKSQRSPTSVSRWPNRQQDEGFNLEDGGGGVNRYATSKRKREYSGYGDHDLDEENEESVYDASDEVQPKAWNAAAAAVPRSKRTKSLQIRPSPRKNPEVSEKNSMETIISRCQSSRQSPLKICSAQSPVNEVENGNLSSEEEL